jgi:hypothetical protein
MRRFTRLGPSGAGSSTIPARALPAADAGAAVPSQHSTKEQVFPLVVSPTRISSVDAGPTGPTQRDEDAVATQTRSSGQANQQPPRKRSLRVSSFS